MNTSTPTPDQAGALLRAVTASQEPANAEAIANMGIGAEASLAALLLSAGGQDNLITWLASYVGAYESLEAWAQEELASCTDFNLPEGLENYFNFRAYADDCLHGCSFYAQELDGLIYIFRD